MGAENASPSVCARSASGAGLIVDRKELTEWLSLSNDLRIQTTPVEINNPAGRRFDPVEVFGNSAVRAHYEANVRFPELSPADAAKKVQSLEGTFSELMQSIHLIGKPDNPKTSRFHGTANFEENNWLTQPDWDGPIQIVCNPPVAEPATAATSSGALSFENVRVRGTPDTLITDRSKTAFASADSGTLSFSYNGQTNTRTDILQAALGYSLLPSDVRNAAVVPYVATNRNVTTVSGTPSKFNIEYVDVGTVFAYTYIGNEWGAVLSGSPHYLMNLVDDSRLAGLHAVAQPVTSTGPFRLNAAYNVGWNGDPHSADHWLEIMPLLDLRSDADFYTDRGTAPLTNQDYFRLGSRFGGTFVLPKLFKSTLTVADVWMYGVTGAQKQLNDFQTSWTVFLDPEHKYFGLSLGYKIGRIEETAQKEQTWMISLTGKY
ncbi:MAG TPA: hypothetical protein VHU18_09995 [Rhizomicrobium sp.]|nr:hypothetical protein [Rhizomicrobium sp.]